MYVRDEMLFIYRTIFGYAGVVTFLPVTLKYEDNQSICNLNIWFLNEIKNHCVLYYNNVYPCLVLSVKKLMLP